MVVGAGPQGLHGHFGLAFDAGRRQRIPFLRTQAVKVQVSGFPLILEHSSLGSAVWASRSACLSEDEGVRSLDERGSRDGLVAQLVRAHA